MRGTLFAVLAGVTWTGAARSDIDFAGPVLRDAQRAYAIQVIRCLGNAKVYANALEQSMAGGPVPDEPTTDPGNLLDVYQACLDDLLALLSEHQRIAKSRPGLCDAFFPPWDRVHQEMRSRVENHRREMPELTASEMIDFDYELFLLVKERLSARGEFDC